MAHTDWDLPLKPLTPEETELFDGETSPSAATDAVREGFAQGGESRSVSFRQGPPPTKSSFASSHERFSVETIGKDEWQEVDKKLESFSLLLRDQQTSLLSLQQFVRNQTDKCKQGFPRQGSGPPDHSNNRLKAPQVQTHWRRHDHPSHLSSLSGGTDASGTFDHSPSSHSRQTPYAAEVFKGIVGGMRLSKGMVQVGHRIMGRKELRDSGDTRTSTKELRDSSNGRYSRRTLDIGLYGNVFTSTYGQTVSVTIPHWRDGCFPVMRALCSRLLAWQLFEPLIILIIALNAVNIGWTIDLELRGRSHETGTNESLELVFLFVFFAEMCIRIVAKGCRSLLVPANFLDFLLVVMTTLSELLNYLPQSDDNFANLLRRAGVLRMMRLLRLSRAVRLVASLKSLWKLVQGLIHGIGTMISALMLLFLTIYIFACFGAEFISKEFKNQDGTIGNLIDTHFSTLPRILLTLFQFITMDSTAAIYVPLIHHSPALAIYFTLLLVVVTIALMNLITAILVEDAICTAQMDDEMKAVYTRRKLKQLTPALHDLFHKLDKTGDGLIQIKEVVEVIKDGLEIPPQLQDFLNPARMVDLFDALDSDNNGELTENEFVGGLTSVALTDVQIETIEILHLLRSLRRDIGRGLFLPPVSGPRAHTPLNDNSDSLGQGSHCLTDLGVPSRWRCAQQLPAN